MQFGELLLFITLFQGSKSEVQDSCKVTNNCDVNAQCVGILGSYKCQCNPGFACGGCSCLDVDECRSPGATKCHPNAKCINTPGSYICQCKDGYAGDGQTCYGTNVCVTDPCLNDGECRKTGHGYRCICPDYFSGKYCEIGQVHTGLLWIGQVKDRIISEIQDFTEYEYDNGTDMSIRDGYADMYDTGNEASFWADGESSTQIVYGRHYDRGDYEFQSTKRLPFTALMRIKNSAKTRSSYSIRVESETGADGKGSLVYFDGNFSSLGVNIVYKVTQVHSARDPSICEVYFACDIVREELFTNFPLLHFP